MVVITSANATGAALKTVQKHASPVASSLKLFASWFCPYVQRLWIALEMKGIDYEYEEINPYDKSEAFLALNPRGLVPVRHAVLVNMHSGNSVNIHNTDAGGQRHTRV